MSTSFKPDFYERLDVPRRGHMPKITLRDCNTSGIKVVNEQGQEVAKRFNDAGQRSRGEIGPGYERY